MGANIFKGFCQSGLWGCFDEFNRIDLEVLSVVAMQVESITSAKKLGLKEFYFPDETNKVKLASVGFQDNKELSKKFTILYALCEEQLSKQRHYDFGLRNILSVLRSAGNILRSEPGASEEMVLMRTLRDMNLSKLVYEDIPLFNALLKDIFPKQEEPKKKTYPEMEKKIK